MNIPVPERDRAYAYLGISGPGTADRLTELLGTEPDRSFSEGEIRVFAHNGEPVLDASGKPKCHGKARWELHSPLSGDAHPNDHAEALLARIEPVAEKLVSLPNMYERKFVVVSQGIQSCGIELTSQQLARLGELGLCLWFDTYPHLDISDLIKGLTALQQSQKA